MGRKLRLYFEKRSDNYPIGILYPILSKTKSGNKKDQNIAVSVFGVISIMLKLNLEIKKTENIAVSIFAVIWIKIMSARTRNLGSFSYLYKKRPKHCCFGLCCDLDKNYVGENPKLGSFSYLHKKRPKHCCFDLCCDLAGPDSYRDRTQDHPDNSDSYRNGMLYHAKIKFGNKKDREHCCFGLCCDLDKNYVGENPKSGFVFISI